MLHVARSMTVAPGLPPEFVSRPALLSALDDGGDRALTLVCAPPGYGKTLLLADWVRRSHVSAAWVSLDEEDDDPRHLWASVLAALVSCPAVPAASPLHRLVVPRGAFGVDFLTEVLEAMRALPTRVCLVLDDVHHLRSPEALHGLTLLVRGPRSNLRPVLAGRCDPALPVARLRMEDQLCEVRTEQLSFSEAETALLTGRCGLSLSDTQIAVLHERTAGWAAGIRLAAMPLRDHPRPSDFLAAFSGDERPVADYLISEVLSRLAPDQYEFLCRTSICDPLPTALAAELTGRADAADVLGVLQHDTGLVVAHGPHRDEFRVQELMRSYLTVELHRHGPALAADLHRRAAVWCSAEGRSTKALAHAAQASDGPLLNDLVHRWAPDLVARGDFDVLGRALATADEIDPAPDAWRPLVRAHMALAGGDRAAARTEVLRARQTAGDPDDDGLLLFRSATEHLTWTGSPVVVVERPPPDPALAALAAAGRGAAAQFPGGGGSGRARRADAEADLDDALRTARDLGLGLLEVQCLSLVSSLAWRAGEQGRAASASTAAIRAAAEHGWEDSAPAVSAYGILAHAQLMRGRPDEALLAAIDGLRRVGSRGDPIARFGLRAARGAALFDTGSRTAGLLALQESHADLAEVRVPSELIAGAALLEHRAALLVGSFTAAASAASRLTDSGLTGAEGALMRAWWEAATGRSEAARATVAPILGGTLPALLRSTVVEARLVEARGALRCGDRPTARRALQAAIEIAEPLDVLRPLAMAGHGLWGLLVDLMGGATDPGAFVLRCLTARQRIRGRTPTTQLSIRERDVLAELTSLSNLGEIADDLEVSVNTIKSHVRAIYGKLGVSTRRSAVLMAYDRGLLA